MSWQNVIGGKYLLADLRTADTGIDFAENKELPATASKDHRSVAILAELR